MLSPLFIFLQLWSSNGGSVMGTTCDTGSPKTANVSDVTVSKPTLLILGKNTCILLQ